MKNVSCPKLVADYFLTPKLKVGPESKKVKYQYVPLSNPQEAMYPPVSHIFSSALQVFNYPVKSELHCSMFCACQQSACPL
jgi:hypothetical protein